MPWLTVMFDSSFRINFGPYADNIWQLQMEHISPPWLHAACGSNKSSRCGPVQDKNNFAILGLMYEGILLW